MKNKKIEEDNGMKKSSVKMDEVKKMSKMLAEAVLLQENEFLIASHPFTDTLCYAEKKDDGSFEVKLLTDPNVFEKWKKDLFKRIDDAKDIYYIYSMVTKPYLLTWLKFTKEYIPKEIFAELLADAWISSENPNADVNVPIKTLAKWFRECPKEMLMTLEDFNVYQQLPDEIVIYRGISEGGKKYGMSWTMNKKKAEWFRDRFNTDGILLKAEINKKNVLAFFNTRNEQEILLDITRISKENIKRRMVNKENFFMEFNGHANRYSSYLLLNTSTDAVIEALNKINKGFLYIYKKA